MDFYQKVKPFGYLLGFEVLGIIVIFLLATKQQSGGADVEFIVSGIEVLIKLHLLISVGCLLIRYKWAKRNLLFIIVCFLIGIMPFFLEWIY